MEYLGFIFGIFGLIAFARVEKLTKELKAKGVLDDGFKGD